MPGNTKPENARSEKKKRRRIRKIGTVTDARRKLWQAITSAEEVLLDDQSDTLTVLKAVHAITSASTAYAKLVEIGEFEKRLEAVETLLKKRQNGKAIYN